jgi:hypothetical protein
MRDEPPFTGTVPGNVIGPGEECEICGHPFDEHVALVQLATMTGWITCPLPGCGCHRTQWRCTSDRPPRSEYPPRVSEIMTRAMTEPVPMLVLFTGLCRSIPSQRESPGYGTLLKSLAEC